jgi:hypothetical protein
MGLMRRWSAVAFLYGVTSLPLSVHAGNTCNIDIHVFAVGCGVLWLSTWLWWHPPETSKRRGFVAAGLVLMVALGLMVKFSGLLLFSIPPMVRWFRQRGEWPWRAMLQPVLILAMAAALVFPYYYQRYYREVGTFFPSANDWQESNEVHNAQKWRDEHMSEYLLRFIQPSPAGGIYFGDLWRDLWIRNDHLGLSSLPTVTMGILYWAPSVLLIALGIGVWWRQWRSDDEFARFGPIFAVLFFVQIGAWFSYVWTQPIPWMTPAKAIYVMPIVWGVVYFQAMLVDADRSPAGWAPTLARIARYAAPFAVLAMVLLNHWLPVY